MDQNLKITLESNDSSQQPLNTVLEKRERQSVTPVTEKKECKFKKMDDDKARAILLGIQLMLQQR